MAKMTREEKREAERAERFARALQSTTDRYLHGCMTRPTWSDHMQSLWGQVQHAGLRADVLRLVERPIADTSTQEAIRDAILAAYDAASQEASS